jgi:hypothetical protein
VVKGWTNLNIIWIWFKFELESNFITISTVALGPHVSAASPPPSILLSHAAWPDAVAPGSCRRLGAPPLCVLSPRPPPSVPLLRGPTHQSLTDTCGGYNHGGIDFPHHTIYPSQQTVLRFPLMTPSGLRLTITTFASSNLRVWQPSSRVASMSLDLYRILQLHLAFANDYNY